MPRKQLKQLAKPELIEILLRQLGLQELRVELPFGAVWATYLLAGRCPGRPGLACRVQV